MTPSSPLFLSASVKNILACKLAQATGGACLDLGDETARAAGQGLSYLQRILEQDNTGRRIIVLGNRTLLDEDTRRLCERYGTVLCLDTAQPPLPASEHHIARIFELPDSLVLVGSGIAPCFLDAERTVFDENVARLYPQLAEPSLAVLPSGEQYKTPETILKLWHAFANAGLCRQDQVAACGGGVTGDLTGFAAATWMRGIPWLNVPTTLLAMIDASTGGKTGCDLPEGKNLAGAFHSPRLVVIDTDFLKTLPARELRSGRSEMLKHSIIGQGTPCRPPALPTGLPTAREIGESLAVKINIVAQDPLETLGRRILLNCGHTIGHAVEKASGYALSHGEAVAIGCLEEARLAVRLGLASPQWPLELSSHFLAAELPVTLPAGMGVHSLLPLIRLDKKSRGDSVEFALPCGWGDVRPCKIALADLARYGEAQTAP